MTDFFDWLTACDSGLGADRLADAFKLSQKEMRKTTVALAPAFALALQRAMLVPGVWEDIARHYKPFMESGASSATPDPAASRQARALTDALFGSPEMVASVARQVSVATGIAPDTITMMMRSLSVMTIENMLQMMATNRSRNQSQGLADGDPAGAMAEMLRRSANAIEAMGRPSGEPQRATDRAEPVPGSDYLTKLFSEALNGSVPWLPPEANGAARSSNAAGEGAAGGNGMAFTSPFEAMMHQFTAGLTGDTAASIGQDGAVGKSEDGTGQSRDRPSEADELARAGLAFQEEYARRMMALFAHSAANAPGKPEGRRADDKD